MNLLRPFKKSIGQNLKPIFLRNIQGMVYLFISDTFIINVDGESIYTAILFLFCVAGEPTKL